MWAPVDNRSGMTDRYAHTHPAALGGRSASMRVEPSCLTESVGMQGLVGSSSSSSSTRSRGRGRSRRSRRSGRSRGNGGLIRARNGRFKKQR